MEQFSAGQRELVTSLSQRLGAIRGIQAVVLSPTGSLLSQWLAGPPRPSGVVPAEQLVESRNNRGTVSPSGSGRANDGASECGDWTPAVQIADSAQPDERFLMRNLT